jgi:Transposase DDE domain group 1
MVQREGLVDKLVVKADGTGQVSHAGSALVAGVADRIGLTRALSTAMAPTRQRRSAHDPGVVLRDLAVMLADGGECLTDLGALRDQLDLYGNVASDATAFRVIDSIDQACLDRLRGAVAVARARAWQLGARPQRREQQQDQDQDQDQEQPELTVIDVDATLTTAYSDKEQAAGNFKGGFGHHPLLCYLDETGEALAGILRPGNAGSNTAADHKQVIDLALAQLDAQALAGKILVRADGAGATHELTTYCREAGMLFSVGFDVDERVREAIVAKAESAWTQAIRADGSRREHSQVCEITDAIDLSGWSEGARLIARRTKLKEGDQQSFADYDGYRLAVFLTDQPDDDIAQLDLIHRGHARVEDRIRQGKDCGLANLPFQSFAHNKVWLWLVMAAQDLIAWTAQLCLADAARAWELKRLRYRLLHQSARIARHARRTIMRLARDWPWSGQLTDAFAALQALPLPA